MAFLASLAAMGAASGGRQPAADAQMVAAAFLSHLIICVIFPGMV